MHYTYKDENGHHVTVTTTLSNRPEEIICGCGLEMFRQFHPARTNWGGIRPSQTRAPIVQNILDTTDERRDKYEKEKP